MKTLISFFTKQNNEVSIKHFEDFAISQTLMNLVRGGEGEGEEDDVSNPSNGGITFWFPEVL